MGFFWVKKSWFSGFYLSNVVDFGKKSLKYGIFGPKMFTELFFWWCFLGTQHKWRHNQLTEMELELKWIHTTTFYNLKIYTGYISGLKNIPVFIFKLLKVVVWNCFNSNFISVNWMWLHLCCVPRKHHQQKYICKMFRSKNVIFDDFPPKSTKFEK